MQMSYRSFLLGELASQAGESEIHREIESEGDRVGLFCCVLFVFVLFIFKGIFKR